MSNLIWLGAAALIVVTLGYRIVAAMMAAPQPATRNAKALRLIAASAVVLALLTLFLAVLATVTAVSGAPSEPNPITGEIVPLMQKRVFFITSDEAAFVRATRIAATVLAPCALILAAIEGSLVRNWRRR